MNIRKQRLPNTDAFPATRFESIYRVLDATNGQQLGYAWTELRGTSWRRYAVRSNAPDFAAAFYSPEGIEARRYWSKTYRRVLAQVFGATGNRPRTFGVEIECFVPSRNALIAAMERLGLAVRNCGYTHQVMTTWKIVTDSSLRSQFSGYIPIELVSPVFSGDEGHRQIELACKALNEVGAKVNQTCGMHVHHGIDDLAADHVRRIVRGWADNQAAIDSMLAPSRRAAARNQYCEPLSPHQLDLLNIDNLRTVSDRWNRYSQVNLASYIRYGTLEIRAHQGTINAMKISSWVRFGQQLIESARDAAVPTFQTADDLLAGIGAPTELRRYYRHRVEALAA